MSKNKVVNQQSFHDGKVVVYQLENRPKQKWLCRIKVPNGKGYLYRGTGTQDLYEARKFADNLFDELRLKVQMGQAVSGKQITKLYDEFEEYFRTAAPSEYSFEYTTRFLKTYALPYFSKARITDLNEAEVTKFFDWRRTKRKTQGSEKYEHPSRHELFEDIPGLGLSTWTHQQED